MMDNKGEKVFADNVDEVLADRIVERVRRNTHIDKSPEEEPVFEPRALDSPGPRHPPLFVFVVLMGAIVLLAAGIAGKVLRRRPVARPKRRRT